ncbi:hypothetical protein P3S67_016118 [Capsicum chacoense]
MGNCMRSSRAHVVVHHNNNIPSVIPQVKCGENRVCADLIPIEDRDIRIHHDGKKVEAQIEELAQKAKEQSIRRKSVKFKVVANDEEKKEEKRKEMVMKKGVVRIRVVVTQEELKQILNGQMDFSSKDDFLRRIKAASKDRTTKSNIRRRLCEDGLFSNGKMNSITSWRPVLESIPEDH